MDDKTINSKFDELNNKINLIEINENNLDDALKSKINSGSSDETLSSSVAWGNITGTLDDQSDLVTNLNNKANKDGSNINVSQYQALLNNMQRVAMGETKSNKQAVVVSSYLSNDGKTWYRIWSDGWKECGIFVNTGTWGGTEIQLPVVFENTNYNVSIGLLSSLDSNFTAMTLSIYSKTKSSVYMYVNQNFQKHIYCCGF